MNPSQRDNAILKLESAVRRLEERVTALEGEPTDEQVERVAGALRDAINESESATGYINSHSIARAAIRAMRADLHRVTTQEIRDAADRMQASNLAELDSAYQAEKQARRTAERERNKLQDLVTIMLENEPDDEIVDGVTVLDKWRADARTTLRDKTDEP